LRHNRIISILSQFIRQITHLEVDDGVVEPVGGEAERAGDAAGVESSKEFGDSVALE